MTEQQIKDATQLLPSYTDEQLIHLWKCAISHPSDRKLLDTYISAIDKERTSRKKAANTELLHQPTNEDS